MEGLDTVARFNKISGLLLSRTEDTLYISDRFNSRIRRLIRSAKMVSSLPNVPVFGPRQLAFNKRRDTMYIANASGHTIVRYAVRSNQGLTWCGQNATFGYLDGNLGASRFYYPLGICQSDSGLIVCDNSNRRFRQISTSGRVKTFAGVGVIGDGTGINSRFSTPYDIVKHPMKDTLYVSDQNNHAIRFINLRNGVVKTIAGNGFAGNTFGIGQNAVLNRPFNMAISRTGDSLYFTEPFSNKIKLLLTTILLIKFMNF
jgi:sugar lactone lactonase YvrE